MNDRSANTSAAAIGSVVFGVGGFILWPIALGSIGIVLAITACFTILRSDHELTGMLPAAIGFVLSCIHTYFGIQVLLAG